MDIGVQSDSSSDSSSSSSSSGSDSDDSSDDEIESTVPLREQVIKQNSTNEATVNRLDLNYDSNSAITSSKR